MKSDPAHRILQKFDVNDVISIMSFTELLTPSQSTPLRVPRIVDADGSIVYKYFVPVGVILPSYSLGGGRKIV
jgi:hypothetical protein